MEVIITDHIRGIKMALTTEQIQNLTDTEPFSMTLTEEQMEAVRKKFPRTDPKDLVIKASEEKTRILWVYRPKPSYCNHTVKAS